MNSTHLPISRSTERKLSKTKKEKHKQSKITSSPTVVKVIAAESSVTPTVAADDRTSVFQYVANGHTAPTNQAGTNGAVATVDTTSHSVVNQLLLDHSDNGTSYVVERHTTNANGNGAAVVTANPSRLSVETGSADTGSASDGANQALPHSRSDDATNPAVGFDFNRARPRTAAGHNLKYLSRDQFAERLTAYCEYIFQKADMDEDSLLDFAEFTALVQSRYCG